MPLIRAKVYERTTSDTSIHMVIQYKNSFNRKFVKVPIPYATTRTTHEYKILKYLNNYFRSTLPYIPRCPKLRYGLHLSEDALTRTFSNTYIPFASTQADAQATLVQTSMIEYPYIPDSTTVDQLTDHQKISCVYQLLLVTGMLNLLCGYTHYDLHINNVMHHQHVWTTGDYVLFVYDEDNQFLIDTHGICPVLIDHEYAYTSATYRYTMGESHLSHYGMTPWCSNTWLDSYRLCRSIVQNGYLSDQYVHLLETKLSTLFGAVHNKTTKDGLLQLGDESIIAACANKLYDVLFPPHADAQSETVESETVPDDHCVLTDGLDDLVQRCIVYTTWTSVPDTADTYSESDIAVLCQEGIEWILNLYDEVDLEENSMSMSMTALLYKMDEYIHDQSCPLVPLMFIIRTWFDEMISTHDNTLLQLVSSSDPLPHGIAMLCTLQQEWGVVFNPIQRLMIYDVQTKSMYETDVNQHIQDTVDKYRNSPTLNQLALASELYIYITDAP